MSTYAGKSLTWLKAKRDEAQDALLLRTTGTQIRVHSDSETANTFAAAAPEVIKQTIAELTHEINLREGRTTAARRRIRFAL